MKSKDNLGKTLDSTQETFVVVKRRKQKRSTIRSTTVAMCLMSTSSAWKRLDSQMAKAQMLWAVGAINDLMEEKKP